MAEHLDYDSLRADTVRQVAKLMPPPGTEPAPWPPVAFLPRSRWPCWQQPADSSRWLPEVGSETRAGPSR